MSQDKAKASAQASKKKPKPPRKPSGKTDSGKGGRNSNG